MELTTEEKRIADGYLAVTATETRGWLVGVVLGAAICAAGAVILALQGWDGAGGFLLPIFFVGMATIEVSLNHRDKLRFARILQKYDAALREASGHTDGA